jgi:uncharacterized protein (TIGR02284 family)
MENRNVVTTLNDLIETSRNGEQGFRLAAEHAHDPQLKTVLQKYAEECGRAAGELQMCVTEAGGKPEKSGTIAGAVHRGWVNLRTAVTKNDDAAILEECERGEDHAKAIYSKALKDDLPPDVRQLVQRQYEGTVQHHETIRDLRNRYAGSTRH